MAGRLGARRGGVWASHDFLALWSGQTVSRIGSEFSRVAIPILAVVTLHGSPLQVSAVVAMEFLPSLLFGLPAGVWVDRLDRRTVLILTDFGRAAVLPVAAVLAFADQLSFAVLYLVVFAHGALTLFYDLAYQSLVPVLVDRADLLDANSKLEASRSVATGIGPAIGGVVIQWLSAATALVVDGASYAVSGVAALVMRVRERPEPVAGRSIRQDLREGMREVVRNPLQWRLIGAAATSNFCAAAILSVFVLFAVRELGLTPLLIGVVFGSGVIGAIMTTVVIGRVGTTLAPRTAITIGLLMGGAGYLLVPLAPASSLPAAVAMLCAAQIIAQAGFVLVAASAMAWRQRVTPNRLLGRVIAAARVVNYGTLPCGALLAGSVAEVVSFRIVLACAAAGVLAATLWLVGTPASPAGSEEG